MLTLPSKGLALRLALLKPRSPKDPDGKFLRLLENDRCLERPYKPLPNCLKSSTAVYLILPSTTDYPNVFEGFGGSKTGLSTAERVSKVNCSMFSSLKGQVL